MTGPAGSGKTTTLKLIAKNLEIEVIEWVTPLDVEWSELVDSENGTFRENQIDKFRDFLFRSSRYSSLIQKETKKLIIVEDLPNTFFKQTEKFEEVLR